MWSLKHDTIYYNVHKTGLYRLAVFSPVLRDSVSFHISREDSALVSSPSMTQSVSLQLSISFMSRVVVCAHIHLHGLCKASASASKG